MQFVSWVFWDTKLELGNSNWIPVICADYYADNFVDCKLTAANEFLEFGVLAPDERH